MNFIHLVTFLFFHTSVAVNIVFFLPGTNQDERRLLNRLAQELAFRNHHVCAFRSIIIPEKKFLIQPQLHGVRELKLNANISKELQEKIDNRGNDRVFWNLEDDSSDRHSIPVWTATADACESIIDSDLMDRLRDELYDVAVVYAGNPCHLGVVHALAMPFIYFDTRGFSDEMVMASSSPWIPSLPLSTRTISRNGFTFSNRLRQLWAFMEEYSAFTNTKPLMRALSSRWRIMDGPISQLFQETREFRKRFESFPNVNEIKKTAAAYFVNSDPVLELKGRPDVPNLLYVGGLHIEYPRPMFPPYNDTNALATDGVIIMSMGSVVNGTLMPAWMKRAFLGAFAKFPRHRIYWRLGSSTLGDEIPESDISKNINFTQFIPQNDLLAADETVLFISNGGSNSIMEAINYGVPVLGIPLYELNYDNLKKLESKGAAVVLHKADITATSLTEAIRKLVREDSYFNNAQKLSRMYKDRPVSALETAMHWVLYVGRHHGAKHRALDKLQRLFFHQHLLLDAVALGLAILWAAWKVLRLFWTLIKQLAGKFKRGHKILEPIKEENSESIDARNGREERNGDRKVKNRNEK